MSRTDQLGTTATAVYERDGMTRVRYHQTEVVSFNDDEIVLATGGWSTVTTKRRMNQASEQFCLGYSVYQRNYDWLVDYRGRTHSMDDRLVLQRRAPGA